MSPIQITYNFQFPDKSSLLFPIEIDEKNLTIISPMTHFPPSWTLLEHKKCSHCPLNVTASPACPAALNLSQLVDALKGKSSYEQTTVTVTTAERTYLKTLSLQDGIFSLLGLILPFTGCPHTQFLKPMARYHLPFSNAHETLICSVSFYLLKQYFLAKNGKASDFKLAELGKDYANFQKVNEGLINRLRGTVKKDLELNALVILNSITEFLTRELSQDLSELEGTFT